MIDIRNCKAPKGRNNQHGAQPHVARRVISSPERAAYLIYRPFRAQDAFVNDIALESLPWTRSEGASRRKGCYSKPLLIFLFCLRLSFGIAQTPEALFTKALENNTTLKALEQQYQAALTKAPQISPLPDPEIGIGGFPLPVETRLGAQQVRLSAGQMFPWPGSISAKKDWANAQADVDLEQISSYRLELLYQIKLAWFRLYENRQSRLVIADNLELLNSLKRLTESKVTAGQASLADVLRVDLKIQELSQELKILASEERKPLIEINQLLHRPLDEAINLPTELDFAELPFQKDTLFSHIQQFHPQLQMLAAKQNVAQKAMAVNEKSGKPNVGLGVDYFFLSPRSDADPENNGRDILQLKATMSIPLFREKYEAKNREESFRIHALENQKEELLSNFLSKIEQAYATYESAQLRQELYLRQIETLGATIQILKSDYSNNNRNFDELLRLEGELIGYEVKLIRAVVMSHIAQIEIERYVNLN